MHPTTADTTVGREKPIIFSGESVSAILAGRKTQTRRVVKFGCLAHSGIVSIIDGEILTEKGNKYKARQPYRVGDRLWVRCAFRSTTGSLCSKSVYVYPDGKAFHVLHEDGGEGDAIRLGSECKHGQHDGGVMRPSIYMPRWASRLTLEVTAVRVERLQEISEADVRAEGIEVVGYGDYPDEFSGKHLFQKAWDTINGKTYPWSSNPWVWVIEFKPVTP